jgi:hypothetical protein
LRREGVPFRLLAGLNKSLLPVPSLDDCRRLRDLSCVRRGLSGFWQGAPCCPRPLGPDRMCAHLSTADRLFMDETTAPVLDPGRGQTRRGSFGRLLPMIVDMVALVHRLCCSATRRDEAANMLSDS